MYLSSALLERHWCWNRACQTISHLQISHKPTISTAGSEPLNWNMSGLVLVGFSQTTGLDFNRTSFKCVCVHSRWEVFCLARVDEIRWSSNENSWFVCLTLMFSFRCQICGFYTHADIFTVTDLTVILTFLKENLTTFFSSCDFFFFFLPGYKFGQFVFMPFESSLLFFLFLSFTVETKTNFDAFGFVGMMQESRENCNTKIIV